MGASSKAPLSCSELVIRQRPRAALCRARLRRWPGGKNFCHQLARGGRAQFHRDAIAPAIRFADEVDAERMIERRVEGMVVIDVGGVDPHPAVRPLGAAKKLGLLNDVGAHDDDLLEASGRPRRSRRGKMFVEE
jgi:hypothetical protein